MLSKKQKSYLKSEALKLTSKYQIGKNGMSESVLTSLHDFLSAHELVKVELLKSVKEESNKVALLLSEQLSCEIIQVIGRKIIIYRYNKEKDTYKIKKHE